MILNLFLIVVIIFLFILLSAVWPPDSPWAPWWRTSSKKAREICKLAKIKKDDLIYDLGSGDGTALITAAKEFGARGIGLEIDPIRYLTAKFLAKKNGVSKKVIFKRKNFFSENIADADAVFVYLVPKTLEKLIPKFKKELKKGTIIVSYRYKMNLKLLSQTNDLYLYST